MGYLHRGMLPQTAQDVVDKLKQGDVSDPLRLLEGIAVFRLTDRKPPKLNPLESARERARDLWLREQGERAWVSLVARLKQETPIHVDESRYESFSAAIEKQVVKK
jgi:parvulin-like peptidyl-prolyl isomerase